MAGVYHKRAGMHMRPGNSILGLVALFFLLQNQHAHSLEIYSGDKLLTKIPPAHFARVASARISIQNGEADAIRLNELLELSRAYGNTVEISDSFKSVRFNRGDLDKYALYILLGSDGSTKLHSPDLPSARFPDSVKRITVSQKKYFTLSFYLLLIALTVAGYFVFGKLRSTFLQCSFLFAAIYFIYLPFDLPSVGNVADNFWYVPAGLSVLNQGNLELSEYRNLATLGQKDYRLIQVGNLTYNNYPFGPSVFTLPLIWLGNKLYSESSDEKERIYAIDSFVAKIIAALAVSLLFAAVFQLTRRVDIALILSLLFAFATNQFNTHAGGLHSHNVGLPLLLAAILTLISPRPVVNSLSAVPLAMAYMTRPTYALIILIITIFMFLYKRRSFLLYVLLGVIFAAVFFLANYRIFGHPISPYYRNTGLGISFFADSLVGHMVSPNRGLLIFSPIFIFSFWGMYLSWKKDEVIYFRLFCVIVILHWIFLAMQIPPRWGGHAIGPRQFCEVLPIWILLMTPAIQRMPHLRSGTRIAALCLFAIAAFWSLYVQLRSVTDLAVHDWNNFPVKFEQQPSRVWDWNDMQILRKDSNAFGSWTDVFCEGEMVARIGERYFAKIASSSIPIRGTPTPVVSATSLASVCGFRSQSIRLVFDKESLVLNPETISHFYLYFTRIVKTGRRGVRPYGSDLAERAFPRGSIDALIVERR